MYQFFKSSLYVILLASVILFVSCQNEEPFQEDIDSELTLLPGSTVIEMMKRTTSNDGSYDNIIDGASCIGIQFPYTVTVNGLEIEIGTMQDFQIIEDILDAAEGVEREIHINYPITVTTTDYTEIVIDDEAMLTEYVKQCVEGGGDDDIECIDVVYPVNIFTYNPDLQQTGNVTVSHDKEMRRFLAGLDNVDLISIDFPLSFEMFDDVEVSVNNNIELVDVMERAIAICDEDDDVDYNDDDFTKASLDSTLVGCPWSVKKFNRIAVDSAQQDSEGTEQYEGYLLTFEENGTVISDDGYGFESEGEWYVTTTDFEVHIEMEFEANDTFNGTHYTYQIGEGIIKLDGGENDEIILEQRCGYENQACSQIFIEENLKSECRWAVIEGQGEFMENIIIDFSQNNIQAYNADSSLVDEGGWSISDTTLNFNGLYATLSHYNGNWEVIACSNERFRLQRGDETLFLVKNCDV